MNFSLDYHCDLKFKLELNNSLLTTSLMCISQYENIVIE